MKYFQYEDHNGFSLDKMKSWSIWNNSNNIETLEIRLVEGEIIILHGNDVTRFFDAIRGE